MVIWWPFRLAGFLPTSIYTAFQENCLMNLKLVTTQLELFLVQVCACGFLHILYQELFLLEYRQVTFGGFILFVSVVQLFYF